jgi:hypothetical protein
MRADIVERVNMKGLLASALAGTIVTFVLGAVVFGVVFAEFFAARLPEAFAGAFLEVPAFGVLALADATYGVMLAVLFHVLDGPRRFASGAMVGVLIGGLVTLHFDLLSAATTVLTTPSGIAVNALLSAGVSGIAAGMVAVVRGRFADAR